MANSKQSQEAASSMMPVDPAVWAQPWTTVMKGAEERMQRMQEVTTELQGVVQRTSQAQVNDLVKTSDRITKTLAKAVENREPTAMITAQPEFFSCFMEAAQTTNRRWLEFMDEFRACSMKVISDGEQGSAETLPPSQKAASAGRSGDDEAAE